MTESTSCTEPTQPTGDTRRRLRNYMLNPRLQLGFAAYLVAVASVLSLSLGWHIWRAYREASRLVALGDPRADDLVASMLVGEDRTRILWLIAILLVTIVFLLAFAIVVTHRIAGPALVLESACKAVARGKLAHLRPLRRRDQLVGLALELNAMIGALREREESERARLAEALRTIEGSPESARKVLEQVVAEKAQRLET